MTATPTANTQAILLLTAPLITSPVETSVSLLSAGEYNRLARLLGEKGWQPSDLLSADAGDLVGVWGNHFARERLEALLGRGFQLSQAVERWGSRGILVLSRADPSYPQRLKARLKDDAPALLYCCGDLLLLEQGGLAVVGSRHVEQTVLQFTESVGKLSAESRLCLVSGGAKGIDRAAINGALQAGGRAVAIMADSLERAAVAAENRECLMDRRLVLASPYDPAAGFNVGNAMQRNKVIYALADAALVVNSDFEKGGTWAGAIEQLERRRLVPVFVCEGDKAGRGNSALISRGGLRWPNPQTPAALTETISKAVSSAASEPQQQDLLALHEQRVSAEPVGPKPAECAREPQLPSKAVVSPAEELFGAVRELLLRELGLARTAEELGNWLGLTKAQTKLWLARLVKTGEVEKVKKTKPVQYRAVSAADRLL